MTKNINTIHKTVLTDDVIKILDPQPGKLYLDVTFGTGGHSKAILEKEPNCKVLAIDWDLSIIEKHYESFKEIYGDRIKILWGNFANLHQILKKENISALDGIIADFGTSQYQIKEREGFSFRNDTKLDMRMSKSHNYMTAEKIINKYPEEKLAKIFFSLGDEKYSKKIAHYIVQKRKTTPITTTLQLAQIAKSAYPHSYSGKIHPATRIFQALRIYVNKELENIKCFLPNAVKHLNKDAPLICISFHSLEDRIVKTFFRNSKDNLKILTTSPITASEEEISQNQSARSAKLRAAKKA